MIPVHEVAHYVFLLDLYKILKVIWLERNASM